MTDQPYLRMLRDLTLVEVLEQIKADYAFEKQKEEVRHQEETVSGAKNSLKKYTQKMILEVYFEDTEDKDRFKKGLSQLGFDYKKNYIVKGYQNIEPLTQGQLNERCGW